MRSKRTIFSLFIALLLSGNLYANGLSLNSIGTNALGMGGAFVGLANDYTAIYWNPAGLSGQETGIMFFTTDVIPFATYNYDMYGISAVTKTNHYISPNIFANYGMGAWSFGLGLYVPAGLGAEWDGNDLVAFGGPAYLDPGQTMANPFSGKTYKWRSELGVFSISPAISYQISEQLSLGVAMNVYYGMFEMDRAVDAVNITQNPPAGGSDGMMDNQYEETSSGLGYGFTVGLKYIASEKVSFGFSFRSETKVSFDGTVTNSAFAPYGAEESDFSRDIVWPMWLAAGIAVNPTDLITLTGDIQFSQWAESSKELVTDYKDPVWDSVIDQQGKNVMTLDWENAIQYRFGVALKASKDLTIRLGFYHDPAPAPDETVNILFPSSTNRGLTGGFSYRMNSLEFFGAAEYLMGTKRIIEPTAENMPGEHQMDVAAISAGLNYFFK